MSNHENQCSEYSQSVSNMSYVQNKKDFINKTQRRNLVVDLDRTFVDILELADYQLLLDKHYQSLITHGFQVGKDFHRINFLGWELVIVIRKGTYDFFKSLALKYSLHVVSYIQKDLTIQILNLIDPDGTIFVMKEKRVKFYEPS